jgi:hypothetical protein
MMDSLLIGKRADAHPPFLPEAPNPLFQHRDAKFRVAAFKFACRPQPSESTTNDRDVNVKVTLERYSRNDRLIQGRPPQRWWRLH